VNHDTYTRFVIGNANNTGNTVSSHLSQSPGSTVVTTAEGGVPYGLYEGFGLEVQGTPTLTGTDLVRRE